MTAPASNLLVMVGKQFACIKIIGRANFNRSVDFRTLVTELPQRGYKYFVIELSECMLMDSTFLGVLAGFGLKMQEAAGDSGAQLVELRNPNARIAELLENLGVVHLFQVAHGPLCAPEDLEPCASSSAEPSREQLTRACLEAHQTLMAINPDNVARFKEVTAFLAEDLQKLQSKP